MKENIGLYPKLTKDYIFKHITQEDIMERYLRIPVNNKTLMANSVLSPFRTDKHPTCNYWYNRNNKLRFRDWDGSFHGDCFDVVAREISVDASTKRGFMLVLDDIAKEFGLHKYKDSKIRPTRRIIKKETPKKDILQFKIKPRRWNSLDASYWYKRYNLDIPDLIDVYPIESLYMRFGNAEYHHIYDYSRSDVAYAYYGGRNEKGIALWKIYFPFRSKDSKQPRFLENASFLQGRRLLVGGKFGGITKSYKDVLCFRKMGIQTVAPHAEGTLITKEDYFRLSYLFDGLFSTMDFDATGINSSRLHKKIYNIEPIMFTNGRFGTVDYGSKDLSDYIEANGFDNAFTLVKETFSKYEEELDKLYTNKINNIRWINQERFF